MRWMGRGLTVVAVVWMVACGDDDTGGEDAGSGCTTAAECDDGVFCNGAEACEMGVCVAGDDPCPVGGCDEEGDTCTDECPDADGDGQTDVACGGSDCDDSDDNRYVGNPEVCDPDDHDEDCDDSTFGFRDQDSDGAPDAECCNGDNCGTDCNDLLATVGGSPLESCDGLDNDCDGMVDEGVLLTFYPDMDGDGYGDPDGTTMLACMAPVDHVGLNTDCDDTESEINPAAFDACEPAMIDQDCDGTPNNPAVGCDCTDGTYPCAEQRGACAGSTFVCTGGSPGACSYTPQIETCNGIDDDCNGIVDDSLPTTTYYRDADGDGFGDPDDTLVSCRPSEVGYVTNDADCDDTDSDAFPGQTDFFDTPRNGGGFDYDCDEDDEQEFPIGSCRCRLSSCDLSGRGGGVYIDDGGRMNCGTPVFLATGCVQSSCSTRCDPAGSMQTIACR